MVTATGAWAFRPLDASPTLEQQNMAWIMGPRLDAPPRAVDWPSFEALVERVLAQSRDPYVIDGHSLLESFEEGLVDQQTIQKHVDHKGWNCASCKLPNTKLDYQCQHCGNGFRGGGPFKMGFRAKGGNAVYTNDTGKTVMTSLGTRIGPGEAYAVMPGEIVYVGTPTPQYDLYDQETLTRHVAGAFAVPHHQLDESPFQKPNIVITTRRGKESGPTDSRSVRPVFSVRARAHLCPHCAAPLRRERLTHCGSCNERLHWGS